MCIRDRLDAVTEEVCTLVRSLGEESRITEGELPIPSSESK